ncbi:MAG: hypothetical protein ABIF19_20470 [Planctomycetota bacterium]
MATYYIGADVHSNNTELAVATAILVFDFELFIGGLFQKKG